MPSALKVGDLTKLRHDYANASIFHEVAATGAIESYESPLRPGELCLYLGGQACVSNGGRTTRSYALVLVSRGSMSTLGWIYRNRLQHATHSDERRQHEDA